MSRSFYNYTPIDLYIFKSNSTDNVPITTNITTYEYEIVKPNEYIELDNIGNVLAGLLTSDVNKLSVIPTVESYSDIKLFTYITTSTTPELYTSDRIIGTTTTALGTARDLISTSTPGYSIAYSPDLKLYRTYSTDTTNKVLFAVNGELTSSNSPTITNNISNSTITTNPESLTIGESGSITITCDDDYQFSGDVSINDSTLETLSGNSANGLSTVSYTFSSVPNTITLSGNTLHYVAILFNSESLLNSTYNTSIENPSWYDSSLTINFVANNGYEFTSTPYITYVVSDGLGGKKYVTENATISDDKLTATITINPIELNYDNTTITLYATPTLIKTYDTGYSFFNIYNLTKTQLNDLAKVRFDRLHFENSTVTYEILDLGSYVVSLKKFYCKVPTVSNVAQVIVLADVNTNVSCNLVTSDKTTIDCGSVTVEEISSNVNDYDNTTIYAILPFIGKVLLDSSLIMGRTISLEYAVSILSGDCVATISTDGIPLYTYSGNISENVPYIINNIAQLQDTLNINPNTLYGFTPKIIIEYHDDYNSSTGYLINDSKYCQLNSLSGLCCIDDIYIIDTDMIDDEKELLNTIARNGIIF